MSATVSIFLMQGGPSSPCRGHQPRLETCLAREGCSVDGNASDAMTQVSYG